MEIVPESLRDPRIHTSVVDVADGFTFEGDQCGDGDELALRLHGFLSTVFLGVINCPR